MKYKPKKSKQKTFMPNFIDLIFFLKTRKVNFAGNKRKKFWKKLGKNFYFVFKFN